MIRRNVVLCESDFWLVVAESDFWLVVAPCASGVIYETQCGGIACLNKRVEGVAVSVVQKSPLDRISCDAGCYGESNWTKDLVAAVNAQIDTGAGWQFDPDRASESTEGWIWVRRGLPPWPLQDDEWWPTEAVLLGPNCD